MTDVCLILEGTFPYVSGGVSSWVNDLIRNLDHLTFSIIYLGPFPSGVKKMHYEMPKNVLDFQEYYIFDYNVAPEKKKKFNKKDFQLVGQFIKSLQKGDTKLFADLFYLLGNRETRKIDLYDFVKSPEAWDVLKDVYNSEEKMVSFIDYFWSWRFIYLPFFSLLRAPLLKSKVYHAVSTGYAGVLASTCKLKYNRPLILTEHGIYTRERKIEIAQADWIYSELDQDVKISDDKEFFKEWWIKLFSFFSLLTYSWSDEIITLYQGNKQTEIEEGADADKIRIIPNGIKFHEFKDLKKEFLTNEILRIGFMGRVVPIKDVKTFIRACKIVSQSLKNIEVFIMGPTDEDENYFEECQQLVEREGLTGIVQFTGKVKIKEYYPKIDIIVLTSISEAQPLVLLEAMSCGIPCVATDVGACREMLYGRTPDDMLIGNCGLISQLYNPQQTADAIVEILSNKKMYLSMSEVGKKRVEKYYLFDEVIANYDLLYTKYMEQVVLD